MILPTSVSPGRFLPGSLAALALAPLVACAGASAPGATPGPGDACVLATAPPGGGAGSLVMAVSGPVDPAHAPVPRNEAERVAFAQLYETLVRIDCRGEARPLLAAGWEVEDGGRRWTFHLRPDARVWNGAAVGAADVTRSWLASPVAGELGALAVIDRRTLEVQLPAPATPAFFARPGLAVALPRPGGGWPLGTGPYRPDASNGDGGPITLIPATDGGGAAVELRTLPGDPRNALDAGVDLLVTRDPATLDYAAAAGGYRRAPLPWDRVYLLLASRTASQDRATSPGEAELESLARDAVRVDARAASPTPADPEACAGTPAAVLRVPPVASGDGSVLYPRDDAVAAALAQRLVALARAPAPPAWVAAILAPAGAPIAARGVAGGAFDDALRDGAAGAFLVAIPRTTATGPCELVAEARRRAPWLGASGIVPLVETRATALLGGGVAGVSVDGAGTLLFPAPWSRFEPDR